VRSGLRAAAWTVTLAMPLTYAVWLPQPLRRHALDGRTLDGELVGPVGLNLEGAVPFAFGVFPVFGLAFGWSVPRSAPTTARRRPLTSPSSTVT
jgi:hypothetical protein